MARDNFSLTVKGTDFSSYLLDFEIDEEFESRSGNTAKIYVDRRILNSLLVIGGESVVLSGGKTTSTDEYLFRGRVMRPTDEADKGRIVLTCRDRLHEYDKLPFSQTFDINTGSEAGAPTLIWKNIVDGGPYSGEVVSTDDSGVTINRFRSRRKSRLERMGVLVDVLDWVMYDDYSVADNSDPIKLAKKSYEVVSTPLIVGSTVVNIPLFEPDLEKMRNEITVEGATEEGEVPQETFSGDASETEFTLSYTPATTKVVVGSVDQVRGVQGQDTSEYDYYVDTDFKKIIFLSPPASGSDNIVVNYTALLDRPVTVEDPASISKYGVRQGEKYHFDDVVDVDDAEIRANQLLNALKNPPLRAKFHTTVTGIKAGMVVQFSNPQNPLYDGNYVVHKVKRNLKSGYDVLTVGDSDFSVRGVFETINSRLKALEESNLSASELLRSIFNLSLSSAIQSRQLDVYRRDVSASNYLHWSPDAGSGVNGQWDDFQWAPDSYRGDISSMSLQMRQHKGNVWREFLYSDDFYDSSSSSGTITWNTTTKQINMSDGSVLYTEVLFKGTAFSYAAFSIGVLTGTVTVELSADNKSTWQTLSEDTRTLLESSTAEGVYLRITATGSVTIEGSAGVYGFRETPALVVQMEV